MEELASNLSTYKEQLREVSSPPIPHPHPLLDLAAVFAAILLVRSVLASILLCGSGFARGCNRIPGLWMFRSDSSLGFNLFD